MNEEILDVVNEFDQVIDKRKRSYIYKKGMIYFRTVNGFLVNRYNELWLPIRTPNKSLWPLHLDASVGGHVKSGETYLDAVIRETKEELNIDINTKKIINIGKLRPYKDEHL